MYATLSDAFMTPICRVTYRPRKLLTIIRCLQDTKHTWHAKSTITCLFNTHLVICTFNTQFDNNCEYWNESVTTSDAYSKVTGLAPHFTNFLPLLGKVICRKKFDRWQRNSITAILLSRKSICKHLLHTTNTLLVTHGDCSTTANRSEKFREIFGNSLSVSQP
jgi:hypothetical protein